MHRNAPLTFKHPAGDLPEAAQPTREPSGFGALALVLVVLATIIGLSTSTRSGPRTTSCGGRSTPSGGASEGN